MNPWDILTAARDHLAAVPGVQTCRIGLEAGMTPDDYPMVRIVPSRAVPSGIMSRRKVEALIYFGQPVHEFEAGLEEQWRSLLEMEAALLVAVEQIPGVAATYRETITDEDRVEAYKLFALRVELVG
jgi:hypothetical protein